EEYVRQVACEMLELEGYRVLSASNPYEALERYERHEGAIDLLLTDVVMPGMDGHDLAEKIAQKQPSIKSIFMSGYTENTLLRRGVYDLTAVYLQKPFTMGSLLDKVRQVLGVSAQWNLMSDVAVPEAGEASL
ncbi:MAG TPA: response regulator, partial [Terriglobales bacterium]